MRRIRSYLAGVTALLALTLTTLAREPVTPLLPPNAVDPVALLPVPPAKGSGEDQADLATVLSLQRTRTDAEVARAKAEDKLTIAAFTSVVGPWFTSENLPQTHDFFKQLDKESKAYSKIGKEAFKAPRPPATDAHVNPVVEDPGEGYPSGHATRGMLMALVLADIMPELKDQLLVRGEQIGWDRVIAGVHFPSDVVAGRVLGQSLARAALANADFRAALAKVRLEINTARKAAASPEPVGAPK